MADLSNDSIVWERVIVDREHDGRPRVVPPKGGRPVPYRRVTTHIDVLEDQWAIRQRAMRLVGLGVAQRDDIQLYLGSLTAEPYDRAEVQKTVDLAYEIGRGAAEATVGSALHALAATVDAGRPLGYVKAPYDKDVKAYQRLVEAEGIEWLAIEQLRVNDDLRIAGTPDRVGRDRDGRVRIYDIKTTSDMDYHAGFSAQFAAYAHSVPYDTKTDTRLPMEDGLDTDVAQIIWLPANKGHAELIPIDIKRGWKACQVAAAIWWWRGQKDLLLKKPTSLYELDPIWGVLIKATRTRKDLIAVWHRAKQEGASTPELRRLCRQHARQLGETLS